MARAPKADDTVAASPEITTNGVASPAVSGPDFSGISIQDGTMDINAMVREAAQTKEPVEYTHLNGLTIRTY